MNNEEIINEIAGIILLLDDEEYSKYNVKLLLVGTPTDIRDYFSKVKESQTIINRTQEVAEVSILTDPQTKKLASKGFFDLLNCKIVDDEEKGFNEGVFLHNVSWFSGNIPQFIHELGLHVSLASEESDRKISYDVFIEGTLSWLRSSLISEHTTMEANINSRNTKVGRKNQVIFAISSSGHGGRSCFIALTASRDPASFFPRPATFRLAIVRPVSKQLPGKPIVLSL